MIRYLKQYRFYLTLFLFLLIPVLAIDTSTRSPREYRAYDRLIIGLISPVQIAIDWTLENAVSFYHRYLYLTKTREENTKLTEENRHLLNEIVNLQEMEQENTRLRKLLKFKEEHRLQTVAARVIGKDVSPAFRSIRINRGEDHGIQKDMAVVNSEGVVGRVLRTTKHTADIITILDSLSAVDAIVLRSRARGIVEGLSDEYCQLKFALRSDDIQPGDLLVSSGLGANFPKGIPVGTVFEASQKPYGITQQVRLKPSVDFSRLEEVMVVISHDQAPIHASEDNLTRAPLPVDSNVGTNQPPKTVRE